MPPGAITLLEEIEGFRPRQRLFQGEAILKAKLIAPNDFGTAANMIPPGYRVHSVKVTMDSTVSNLLGPGDRVDVIVYLRQGNGTPETAARTLLQNIRVFAVNADVARAADQSEGGIAAKTVSLLVTPPDGERLTLASSVGEIKLALRRPDDEVAEEGSPGIAISKLFQHDDPPGYGKSKTGFDPKAIASTEASGLFDLLKNQARAPVAAVTVPAGPSWITDIIGSNGGVRRYEYGDDPLALPREVSGGGFQGTTPNPAVTIDFDDDSAGDEASSDDDPTSESTDTADVGDDSLDG